MSRESSVFILYAVLFRIKIQWSATEIFFSYLSFVFVLYVRKLVFSQEFGSTFYLTDCIIQNVGKVEMFQMFLLGKIYFYLLFTDPFFLRIHFFFMESFQQYPKLCINGFSHANKTFKLKFLPN